MWRQINTRGQSMWTCGGARGFVMMMAVLVASTTTLADSPNGAAGRGPDPAAAEQAYRVAENWLEQAHIPSSTVTIEAAGVFAVEVTLRDEGRRLGKGQAETSNPLEATGESRDVMPLVQDAIRVALREAMVELGDTQALREAASDMELDIQFAYGLERVHLESLADLPSHVTLGLDGLALQRGRNWAWSFPGTAIAANRHLPAQLTRLISGLNLPVDHVGVVGTQDGPAVYRFQARHVVRSLSDGQVLELHRGNRLLPATPLSSGELQELTDDLLGHLLGRQHGDGRFAGTYEPTADEYEPSIAEPLEAASATYALARASRLSRLDPDRQDEAAQAALRTLNWLSGQQQLAAVRGDLATAAMTLIALLETPGAGDLREMREALGERIVSLHQDNGWFATPDEQELSIAAHALATAALVRLYDRTRDEDVLERAHVSLDGVWGRLDDPRRATDAMPWLAMAELDLERLNRPSGYLGRLRETGDAIWRSQVNALDRQAQRTPDVVGGFAVDNAIFTEPTWQSARVLAGQARVLPTRDLFDDGARAEWLLNTVLGARFLKQLTMQVDDAFYASNRSRAIGGTRSALWNNRQPLAATAMALLAMAEVERSLTELVSQ